MIYEKTTIEEPPILLRIYKDLEGTIDLHIHSIPDASPRLLDDIEVVAQAKAVKMRAVVLKCHVSPTPGRAYVAQRAVKGGIDVYGIICLNPVVGGMNPEAVTMALRMGAKGVWMPSTWSKHNVDYMRRYQRPMGTETLGRDPIEEGETILSREGQLKSEVKEILALVAEQDVMLSTGHLSLNEAHTLVDEASKIGVKKLLIHTVNYHVMGYPVEDQKIMVRKGAFLEFGFTSLPYPIWEPADPSRRISLDDVCRSIRMVGAEHCVLSTDSGQVTSPPPIECMRLWIELLRVKGFDQKEIDAMTKWNPAKLLGLESRNPGNRGNLTSC
jgi:hypothetical protein